MITTVDEVNSDKTKVPEELFFVVFCLIVLLPNSMGKLIHNRCKLNVSLLLRLYRCIRVCKRTVGSLFLCFRPLFSSEILGRCSALKLY